MNFLRHTPFMTALLLGASTLTSNAYAFPEMVRHGYSNCTACHSSPSGGGILNAYGRSTSQAVLSAYGQERESLPMYGVAPLPEAFQIQAFVRGIQVYQDTPQASSGDSQFMQADLSASAVVNQFTVVATGGLNPNTLSGKPTTDNKFFSREHYVMYRPDSGALENTSLRLGRFMMDYGIHEPDHTVSIRQGLGFGPYAESYNLEAGYQGERFSGAVTGVFGRPERTNLKSEQGLALTGAIHLAEKYKFGLSFFQGYSTGASRQVAGPYGILGFTERFYLLTEWDWQFRHGISQTNSGASGFVSFNRLGYELIQGLHFYIQHQNNFSHLGEPTAHDHSFAPGILFYPRPHFEFQAQLGREYNSALDQNETSGFLMGSFYL
ncbi:MAG: hypothetical protein ACJ763_16480 [Bdellovibrionia bacterium]